MSCEFRVPHMLCAGSVSGKLCSTISAWRVAEIIVCNDPTGVWLSKAKCTCVNSGEPATCLMTFWDGPINISLSPLEAYWMGFRAKKPYTHLVFVRRNCKQSLSVWLCQTKKEYFNFQTEKKTVIFFLISGFAAACFKMLQVLMVWLFINSLAFLLFFCCNFLKIIWHHQFWSWFIDLCTHHLMAVKASES